ncbi:PQQ-dependent sugar dehydrogenase [Halodurantibacterium flavum]|uniref:PQQ-dependent sugar dehydrogenase n=1 Tax=Halodurantibacterium flavum TaxID=1382802 RepID=A0ABW4S2W5_9RHOB
MPPRKTPLNRGLIALGLGAGMAAAGAATAQDATLETSLGEAQLSTIATGLNEPWAIAFLPQGEVLVSERDGRLLHFRDGEQHEVTGLPEVFAQGQGGLLDVVVPQDFDTTREILFSFARPQGQGAGTALAAAAFDPEASELSNLRILFEAAEGFDGGRHFGSRIVEGPDGTVFLGLGDRGTDDSAQDLSNHNGAVIRVNRDGSVPADNPFVGQEGAQPEIWSYGHRNIQGAAMDAQGRLWVSEHGAQGGDEINLVEPGLNYGWPEIAYGRNYDGTPIGIGTEAPGMEQPDHYWDPSPAPSGHMIYSGTLWPEWEGHHFIGMLQGDHIARLDPADWSEEQIASGETIRIRDVREAPDGTIWFLSIGQGALIRMAPADADLTE